MSYKLQYVPSAAHKKGESGKAIFLIKIDPETLEPLSGETFFDCAYTQKVSIKHDAGIDEFKDMHGDVVQVDDGDVKSEFKLTLGQDDANTMNFLMNETSGYYYGILTSKGAGAPGYKEFQWNPKVRISTSYSEDIEGRTVEMSCSPLSAPVAWDLSFITGSASGSLSGVSYNFSQLSTLSGAKSSYVGFKSITA